MAAVNPCAPTSSILARAPILQRYLQLAPGAGAHIPVDPKPRRDPGGLPADRRQPGIRFGRRPAAGDRRPRDRRHQPVRRGSVWSALLGALVIGSISNGMDLLGLRQG